MKVLSVERVMIVLLVDVMDHGSYWCAWRRRVGA
jgi:hypothetical protein